MASFSHTLESNLKSGLLIKMQCEHDENEDFTFIRMFLSSAGCFLWSFWYSESGKEET